MPIDKSISTHHLFGATMIGYFGNGILFFRLGELLKAYAISQGRKIKPSESFGLTFGYGNDNQQQFMAQKQRDIDSSWQ